MSQRESPCYEYAYEWQKRYFEAIREEDPELRRTRIATAERAILSRLPELVNNPAVIEHQTLREALDGLHGMAETFRLREGARLTLNKIIFLDRLSTPTKKYFMFAMRFRHLIPSVWPTLAHFFHAARNRKQIDEQESP
jgi:hypothetical protein